MTKSSKPIPKKYHPQGFEILYEDQDIIVGNKAPGFLTVRALWNKEQTIHAALNQYVRKGNAKSRKCVYVVHRLDQDTSGVLVFAKSEKMQQILKSNWKNTIKKYYAVVHGRLDKKQGEIQSYLQEDDDYHVHSYQDPQAGKLARTGYRVVKEYHHFSVLEIDLLTGRKNQIRVHLAQEGAPVVGDTKYGKSSDRSPHLFLHAHRLTIAHPFSGQPMTFEAPVPEYFIKLVGVWIN